MNPFEQYQRYTQRTVRPIRGIKPKNGHLYAIVLTLIAFAIADYLILPAYNLRNPGIYFFIAFFLVMFGFLDQLFTLKFTKAGKYAFLIAFLLVVFSMIAGLLSSEFLLAKQYRDQIVINEVKEFDENFETIALNRIPIVDLQTARQLGDKQLGTVSGLGSQFFVNPSYTLISSNEQIYRVAPLDHRDFFKWFQNRDSGIQAYVRVNVTNQTDVQLINLPEGMRFSPHSYFNQNLTRHIRFKYRTAILHDYAFEIDDQGKPYWVVSVVKPEIGWFGGLNAQGAIIVDPISGDMEYYEIADLPLWVNRVQPSDLAWAQIDNWGYYVNGFINTLFSQKDMLQTTDGYNYVSIQGQAHVYSGLTSLGGDRSIVGFALINLRTREATYYQIGGADEYAAMSSAEGQVQHLNYRATFPVLINMNGIPTYFVALKDQEGLVKMYSFIAVSNYDAVGVGDSVLVAQRTYQARLREVGMISDDQSLLKTVEMTVASVSSATIEGNSIYYLTFMEDSRLFVVPISVSVEVLFAQQGDKVMITYLDSSENIIVINEFDHLGVNFEAP